MSLFNLLRQAAGSVANAATGRLHLFASDNGRMATRDENGDVVEYFGSSDTLTDGQHGDRGGGSLHATVVAGGDAGFMAGADKSKLDGVESGATADQTGAEIKSAYEGEADTNAYTDSAKQKVDHLTVTAATDLDAIRTRVYDLDAAVVLKGEWDASTGSFPGGGTAGVGNSWIVNTDGTVDSIEFREGDRIIALTDDASTSTYAANWIKADYTDRVSTVHGRTGAVVSQSGDYDASQITNDSGVSGADVAAALDALDTAKANSADLGALATKDTVATADIEDAAATNAKLANMAANTIKARLASSGAPQDVAIAANRLLARASTGDLEAKTLTDFALNLLDDADAATMRSTLGLGSAAQSEIINLPFPNVLLHSGRFEQVFPTERAIPGSAINSDIYNSYNSSTFSDAGRFIHDNSTNGGSAGALSSAVQDLLSAMGRAGSDARFGVDFWVLEITCGSGTGGSRSSPSGASYLAYMLASSAVCGFNGWGSGVMWVRSLDGFSTLNENNNVSINGGALQQGESFEITPADGWVHAHFETQQSRGYNSALGCWSGNDGDRIQIAIPATFVGRVNPGIHTSPLPGIFE